MRTALVLLVHLAAAAAAPAQTPATLYPACGDSPDRWSLDEGPAAFYHLADKAERSAALSYEGAAESDIGNSDPYRAAALATERAIADLAAAAQAFETAGQLRYARRTRGTKAKRRREADEYWQQVESLGGEAAPGEADRRFACDELPQNDAHYWQTEADRHLGEAERLIGRVIEIAEMEADREVRRQKIRPLDEQIARATLSGSEALANAGCLDEHSGLGNLLEASWCYFVVGHPAWREVDVTFPGDIDAERATVLREIARRLEVD